MKLGESEPAIVQVEAVGAGAGRNFWRVESFVGDPSDVAVPGDVRSRCNALILGTGRRAFLWWKSERSVKDMAASTAKLLKDSWFRRASFDGGASLFEITPGYVFSFFLLGDCASRISWDFFGAAWGPGALSEI
eukprot:Skav204579  [mRNA]  locus=scaffold767:94855:97701:- [translate_table: standard]